MAALPVYVQSILEAARDWDFSAGFCAPATLDALVQAAPLAARHLVLCPTGEIALLLRALGEAEATMLYDRCDALLAGQAATAAVNRRVFLRSLEQRLRKAYGRAAWASGRTES